MKVTINLQCQSCHHRDHSGSFTHGGARAICGHSGSCKARKSIREFKQEYPMYAGRDLSHWKHHWYNRIIDDQIDNGEVPDWCPVKNGLPY